MRWRRSRLEMYTGGAQFRMGICGCLKIKTRFWLPEGRVREIARD